MPVSTFIRIYAHGAGPECPARPALVANVLRSMQESADGDLPFAVLLRMDDGSSVTVRPKRSLGAPK